MHAARKEFQENNLGIEIITRLRGQMLTKRSKALSNTNTRLRMITDIGFADDCVLCANSAEDLQQMIDITPKDYISVWANYFHVKN